jgi:DNA-binding TFAR19-related protein (PDSD5 family)
MPCNSIVYNTVELEHDALDSSLLEAALKSRFDRVRLAIGRNAFVWNVDGALVSLNNGKLTSTLPESRLQEITGQIKQAYGKEAVKYAAKRFGWVAQFESADPYAFTLRKD